MFTRIEDATMAERVTRQIQTLIAENQLKPGDRLPTEKALGEELGVSRTVVREAIRGLVAKGLLDVSPGRAGTTIRQPSPDATAESMTLYLTAGRGGLNYEKVLEVRRVLEVGITALAAERRDDEDLRRLREFAQPLAVRSDVDERAFMQRDQDFHEALAAATHNEIFVLLLTSMRAWMWELRRAAVRVVRRTPSITRQHLDIFDRIQAGDVEGARAAMIAHLDEAERIQRAALNLPRLRAQPRTVRRARRGAK